MVELREVDFAIVFDERNEIVMKKDDVFIVKGVATTLGAVEGVDFGLPGWDGRLRG